MHGDHIEVPLKDFGFRTFGFKVKGLQFRV